MKANYGIDAPTVVLSLITSGAGCLAASLVPALPSAGRFTFLGAGLALFLSGTIMLIGSKVFKLRLRDPLLDSLSLKGDETVLDLGCGSGLMLIGLANRLPKGRAFGVNLWRKSDQSGNSIDVTLRNAEAENVQDRIQIETADMRQTPFDDQTFDAVVSSWAIHNILTADGRKEAVLEAVRILKPGGKLLIVDILATKEYVAALRESNLADIRVTGPNFSFLIPSRTTQAKKPIK